MTFEQQSQTDLKMNDPELLHQLKNHRIHKRVVHTVEDSEEEEQSEEYVQSRRYRQNIDGIKKPVARYGRIPKPPTPLSLEEEKAKIEKLKKLEQIEREAENLFGEADEVPQKKMQMSPKTPQTMMMSTADESTTEKRFSPESAGKRHLRGGKRTYGDKKVRFDLISESESTPLPAKRRTRSKVNYAQLDNVIVDVEEEESHSGEEAEEEEDEEEQEEVVEQPLRKRQRVNPEDERRAREIK